MRAIGLPESVQVTGPASSGFVLAPVSGITRMPPPIHQAHRPQNRVWSPQSSAAQRCGAWGRNSHRSPTPCFAKGTGVPKDTIAAYALYNTASARGLDAAKTNLVAIEKHMSQAKIRQAQALSMRMHGSSNPIAELDAYLKTAPSRR